MHRLLAFGMVVAALVVSAWLWLRAVPRPDAPQPVVQAIVPLAPRGTPTRAPDSQPAARVAQAPAEISGVTPEVRGGATTVVATLVATDGSPVHAARELSLLVSELDAPWSESRSVAGTSDAEGRCSWSLDGPLLLRRLDVAATDVGPGTRKWLNNAISLPGEEQAFVVEVSAGATLAGRVVDDQGLPVPGAEVATWSGSSFDPTLPPERVVRADAGGRFEIEHLGRPFALVPRGGGRVASLGLRGDLADGERIESGLEVVLVPAWRVAGQVLGPRGEPLVASLRVRAHGSYSSRDATAVPGVATFRPADAKAETDVDGRFELGPLPRERVNVRVTSEIFGYQDLQLPTEPGPWTIRFEDGVVVRGSVVDPAGAPVADAEVGIAGDGKVARSVRTRADGSFELRGLPEHEHASLYAAAAGLAPWMREGLELTLERPLAPVVIRLEPGLPLSGRVVDAGGGPAVGVRVVLEGERSYERGYSSDWPSTLEHLADRGESRTDLAGAFAFDALYPGAFEVRAYPDTESELFVEVLAQAGDRDVELRLDPASYERVVLSGRVLDALDGTPVASFVVTPMITNPDGNGSSGRNHPVRDPEGRFRVALAHTARAQLTVKAEGYFQWSEPTRDLDDGEHTYDVRLVRERFLELRLTWPDGTGVDAELDFRDEQDVPLMVHAGGNTSATWSSVSTVDGVARAVGLPAGVVLMRVRPRSSQRQPLAPQEFTLDLRRDSGPVLEFVLDATAQEAVRRPPMDAFAMVLSAARDAEIDLAALEQHVVGGGWKDLPESVQLLAVDADLDVLAADGRRLMTAEVRAAAEGRTLTWRELDTGEESEIELPAEVGCVLGGTFPAEATLLRIRAAGHDPLELAFDATRENGGLPHVLVLRR